MEISPFSCMNNDHLLCIGRIPIFSTLNDEELCKIQNLILHQFYHKDEYIYVEGEVNKNLIIVQKGKLKVFSYTSEGREQIFYILANGDFMGVRNLILENEATFSVQAMVDSQICKIEKADFKELFIKHPLIGWKAMEVLCGRLEKMESLVKRSPSKEADARVNMMLLEFSNRYGFTQEDGIIIDLPLNRADMASYIGISRETLCRKLAKLKAEGIIRQIGNKKLLIVDKEALKNQIEH